MKIRHLLFLLSLASAIVACNPKIDEGTPQSSKQSEIDQKVAQLIQSMSIEEKAGQMTQITLDVLTEGDSPMGSYEPLVLDDSVLQIAFEHYQVGSVLNTANNRARSTQEWNRLVSQIQDYAIRTSKHNIPVIYGVDMIHGASYVANATLFPQQIGMAATWNPELVKKAAQITAYETRAAGIPWTFSPVLDLGIDPRWPRQWETFGEDPLLASTMGHHIIKGYEGDDNQVNNPMHIASCMKHFFGYSQPLSGKDRTPAWLPENKLRQYHLPTFKAGVDAGAHTIMINSGEINGVPMHINKYLLTDVLKNELGFQGFAVTDWRDIEYLHNRHKVAATLKDAVKMAINAGIDMSMVPYNFDFTKLLIELVKEGEVPMSRIDDAVSRILKVKFQLGLFETPYTVLADYPEFGSEAHEAASLHTAGESITLLKNMDNLLPLSKNAKILVGGPAANTMRPLNGGWSYSWQGNLVDEFAEKYATIYEALSAASSNPSNIVLSEGVQYASGGSYMDEIVLNQKAFLLQAQKVDYIVLAIGENTYTEKPGDLTDMYLSTKQLELVELASRAGKPIILVMVEGRPRVIRTIEPLASAILQAYLPGNHGGKAIAQILYGEVNPSGKLPYTYPRFPNSLEPYYHKNTEQLTDADAPAGTQYNPQFEFGFGLSYSSFAYQNLRINMNDYSFDGVIKGSVEVTNMSDIAGKEVVQVYVTDHFASNTPEAKRLRFFEKVNLQANETKTVAFEIKIRDLSFVNQFNQTLVEKGTFSLMVGEQSVEFNVTETKIF